MLSKLEFFRSHGPAECERLRSGLAPAAWEARLGVRPGSLRPVRGGTLNVVFEGEAAGGRRRIFKTSLTGSGRAALGREAAVLDGLYGARCDVGLATVDGRDWLSMRPLDPHAAPVSRGWMSATLERAAAAGLSDTVSQDMDAVVDGARLSLPFLAARGEVPPALESRLAPHLSTLAESVARRLRRPCHGDLGPRNIMTDAEGPILLDWEDAFLGIDGYDWIYWLSFHDNRALLDRRHLAMSGLPADVALALLAAILLVKCELAVRTGATAGNSLSTAQRLDHALAALERG